MGYLDNTSITVDAVLTKKGRELLKDGKSLNIDSFTLSDTGVDYTLFNTNHPSGSAKYGEAIENLPMLEASVHAEYNMRNRLISLNQSSIAIPAFTLSGTDSKNATTLTFNNDDPVSSAITLRLVGFSSANNQGVTAVVQRPSVVDIVTGAGTSENQGLSGTTVKRNFLTSEEIPQAVAYDIPASIEGSDRVSSVTIRVKPQDNAGQVSFIYFNDNETGATIILTVTNNRTKPASNLLSTGGIGA
tara:strand:+ start:434 stop:1168 length:735 start_codon:yes stop_codon:yes gene_type:complete